MSGDCGPASRLATLIVLGALLPGPTVPVAAPGDGLVTRAFPMAGQGEFEIRFPATWRQDIESSLGLPPTLVFTPPAGNDFVMQMTPFPNRKEGTTLDEIRTMVETMAQDTLMTAVESTLPLRQVEGEEAMGFVYSATDKAPGEGEWRCATQGVARVGGLVVTFTFLTQSHEAPEVGQALEMIRTARHRRATAADASTLWTLTYPGKSWSLVLDLPGFQSTGRQTKRGGTQVMAGGENPANDMIVSIYLEKADMPGNAVAYRDRHRKRLRDSPIKKSDIQASERGLMSMLEYVHRSAMGLPINQKHMNGIIVHDGVWIDIHLSKSDYVPFDRPLFDAVFNSVRIVQGTDPATRIPAPPVPDSAPSTPAVGTFRSFTLPGRGWSLVLDALGIAMDKVQPVSPSGGDGSGAEGGRAAGRLWSGSETASGYTLSVLIQAAEKPGDAFVCRDTLWERSPEPGASRVRKTGSAEQASVEYTVPSNKTRDLRIFRVHDGYWIVVHLSKVGYRESDAILFENLRSSVAIRDHPAGT